LLALMSVEHAVAQPPRRLSGRADGSILSVIVLANAAFTPVGTGVRTFIVGAAAPFHDRRARAQAAEAGAEILRAGACRNCGRSIELSAR
jgi:hypothetical protein